MPVGLILDPIGITARATMADDNEVEPERDLDTADLNRCADGAAAENVT